MAAGASVKNTDGMRLAFRMRGLLLMLAFSLAVAAHAQESGAPSLGDVARQARSQKAGAKPATVITNDNLPAASPGATLDFGESGAAKNATGADALTTSSAAGASSSPLENL